MAVSGRKKAYLNHRFFSQSFMNKESALSQLVLNGASAEQKIQNDVMENRTLPPSYGAKYDVQS